MFVLFVKPILQFNSLPNSCTFSGRFDSCFSKTAHAGVVLSSEVQQELWSCSNEGDFILSLKVVSSIACRLNAPFCCDWLCSHAGFRGYFVVRKPVFLEGSWHYVHKEFPRVSLREDKHSDKYISHNHPQLQAEVQKLFLPNSVCSVSGRASNWNPQPLLMFSNLSMSLLNSDYPHPSIDFCFILNDCHFLLFAFGWRQISSFARTFDEPVCSYFAWLTNILFIHGYVSSGDSPRYFSGEKWHNKLIFKDSLLSYDHGAYWSGTTPGNNTPTVFVGV